MSISANIRLAEELNMILNEKSSLDIEGVVRYLNWCIADDLKDAAMRGEREYKVSFNVLAQTMNEEKDISMVHFSQMDQCMKVVENWALVNGLKIELYHRDGSKLYYYIFRW